MRKAIVIVGCGGHGREMLGIIDAINKGQGDQWNVTGFIDDNPNDINLRRLQALGVAYLGPSAELAHVRSGTHFIAGIGDSRVRAAVTARVDEIGLPAAHLIHPAATVGLDTSISEGVVLFAGARVTTNVKLGRHVHVNQNATVGHDSVLADHVSVNPLAAISGECELAAGVLVGTNAAILQGLRIGAGAVVGAGSCVVRDVSACSTVKGVPAR